MFYLLSVSLEALTVSDGLTDADFRGFRKGHALLECYRCHDGLSIIFGYLNILCVVT